MITNDICTKEDRLILTRVQALPADRIMGVETGGCPHTALREDATVNLAAMEDMKRQVQAQSCVSSNLEEITSRPRSALNRLT